MSEWTVYKHTTPSGKVYIGITNMFANGVATEYASAKVAEQETGVAACNITRVCRGQRMTAGGARWEYA